jgi:hypothetical protein
VSDPGVNVIGVPGSVGVYGILVPPGIPGGDEPLDLVVKDLEVLEVLVLSGVLLLRDEGEAEPVAESIAWSADCCSLSQLLSCIQFQLS